MLDEISYDTHHNNKKKRNRKKGKQNGQDMMNSFIKNL